MKFRRKSRRQQFLNKWFEHKRLNNISVWFHVFFLLLLLSCCLCNRFEKLLKEIHYMTQSSLWFPNYWMFFKMFDCIVKPKVDKEFYLGFFLYCVLFIAVSFTLNHSLVRLNIAHSHTYMHSITMHEHIVCTHRSLFAR